MRKRLLLVPDGMADEPQAALGGKTPLEAARTPVMDALARGGICGLAKTVPDGMAPGSDVANLAVLGYDPAACYTGRSPLEAASIGVELGPDDVAYRLNLVTVAGGLMKDNTAGHIDNDEARRLRRGPAGPAGQRRVRVPRGRELPAPAGVARRGRGALHPAARHPRPAGGRPPARRGRRGGRRRHARGDARGAAGERDGRARARAPGHERLVLGRGHGSAHRRRSASTSASRGPWSAPWTWCAASAGSPGWT